MSSFELVKVVPCAPERVWAVLADVERWPEWAPTVTAVQALDPGGLRLGARYRLEQPKLAAAVWTVAALQEGRSFTWENVNPGVRSLAFHLVEPVEGGTRLTLRVELTGAMAWLSGKLAASTIRAYIAQEADALAKRAAALPAG